MRELDARSTAAVVAVQRLQTAYGDAVTRRAWDEVRALFAPTRLPRPGRRLGELT